MVEKVSRSAVYMAECEDDAGNLYLKVGKAKDPLGRIPSLQVGCPFAIRRVRYIYLSSDAAAFRAERRIQAALSRFHLRGEWFLAKAGDEVAARVLEITPADVVSAMVKGPVAVRSLDMVRYEESREKFRHMFGDPLKRRATS